MSESLPRIDEPPRSMLRHPTDLQRLIVGILATVVGFGLATYLNTINEAITVEVINGIGTFPRPLVVVTLIFIDLLAFILPLAVLITMIKRRQWRRLLMGLIAVAVAIALVFLIETELVDRFSSGDLPYTPPSWVCDVEPTSFTLDCVPGTSSRDSIWYLAAVAAFYSTLAPYLTSRWRLFSWILIVLLAVARAIGSLDPAIDDLLIVGLAYSVGAGVLLAFGTPDRRPRGQQIADAIARGGVDLASLSTASVDARGSTPYFAETRDGRRLFVKVLTPEERAADNLFRVMRMARLKGVGDERPFSSLKRAVEHEAVVSLMASSVGVQTPKLEALADIPPSSVVLAYDMIDGGSLDSVEPEALTDDVLTGIWEQVAMLRTRRIAHRDLRLANVFLDADGSPWLIDFGFSELAATDGQLRSDVAELVMSTAEQVGPERAVASAVRVLGPEAVAEASSRIQPVALSGATRDALKQHKGLDGDVRDEIASQTATELPELEDLERIKGQTVLMVVGIALAIYFLIPQLAQTDFGAILDADWRWLPGILVASFLTYVGAAWNIMGSVPDRIRLIPTVFAQLAGTFINRITPVKVGGMATNVRYMQKSGVDTPVAVAGIGVSSVGTFIVHMSLLIMSVVFVGRNATDFIELPSGQVVLLGLVGFFAVLTLVWFVPFGRKIVATKVWPVIKQSGQGILQVATSPRNAVMLFGGAFLMIMSYITALWLSLEAFGGGLSFVGVAVVFLAGQALGQAAPTPGGIGATEAAMIAAMTALGLDAAIAVPTVFLYRVATFWLPILPGFLALRKLQADDIL